MRKKKSEVFIPEGIEKYMTVVQEVYGDELLMAALYGSAATGSYVTGVSDINMLFVVQEPNVERLIDLGQRSRRITETYRITAHILSKQELLTSGDVFPVEYLEIADTMELIHGTDLITSMAIDKKNLRHQVESMIRGEINSLRQLVIASFGRRKLFTRELRMWAGRQAALFRALMRLTGSDSQRHDAYAAAEQLAETFEISSKPLLDLEDLREDKPVSRSIEEIIGDVLHAYITIAEIIDGPTYR